MLKFAYGITTVPSRVKDVFPRTLASLATAGFDKPHLFVDGCQYTSLYDSFELEATYRHPNVRTAGHWALSIAELYIRSPQASHYIIFQDDFVTYKNLRGYLEQCHYPANGYFNLYTFPSNQKLAPKDNSIGWYLSNQGGKGAVALILPREVLLKLLGEPGFINRPQDIARGHKAVDGGIVTALKKCGISEYVHNPTLVQHTGLQSSMGNRPHLQAISFRGEDFDALELLEENKITVNSEFYTEWEQEKIRLETALLEDQNRLQQAITPNERRNYSRLIAHYQQSLTAHLKSVRNG